MGNRLNIKNPEAVALARRMAAEEGVSITQVVLDALRMQHAKLIKPHQIGDIASENLR